jgi:hypothetical protein
MVFEEESLFTKEKTSFENNLEVNGFNSIFSDLE